jgi:uncharacterized protein (TIGR03435 family)
MLARLLLAAVLGLGSLSAQSFEVASIRLHEGRAPHIGILPSGARLTVTSVSVRGMIMYAYNLQDYEVTGGPAWAASEGWDITAKAEGELAVATDQFKLMLQSLLADRFQLKFHRETKEIPVYVLAPGKNPPKLKENNDPAARSSMTLKSPSRAVTAIFTKSTMDQLVNQLLSHEADRPVLNKTGLTGTYDFTLEWTPEGGPPGEIAANPSAAAAVQEQLGLKLEPQKLPVEVLAIDHAEKPSEN